MQQQYSTRWRVALIARFIRAERRQAERATTAPFTGRESLQLDRLLAAEALIAEYRAVAAEPEGWS